jgi:hypothetical protein
MDGCLIGSASAQPIALWSMLYATQSRRRYGSKTLMNKCCYSKHLIVWSLRVLTYLRSGNRTRAHYINSTIWLWRSWANQQRPELRPPTEHTTNRQNHCRGRKCPEVFPFEKRTSIRLCGKSWRHLWPLTWRCRRKCCKMVRTRWLQKHHFTGWYARSKIRWQTSRINTAWTWSICSIKTQKYLGSTATGIQKSWKKLRPITSNIDALTEHLFKWLTNKLKGLSDPPGLVCQEHTRIRREGEGHSTSTSRFLRRWSSSTLG